MSKVLSIDEEAECVVRILDVLESIPREHWPRILTKVLSIDDEAEYLVRLLDTLESIPRAYWSTLLTLLRYHVNAELESVRDEESKDTDADLTQG